MGTRICDLPISVAGTWLEPCIRQLYEELAAKGLCFRPACYLADEWLTPENEPVIGIPFYLAHPVLTRLEKKMMLEAEGETEKECMKLLRHEAGHAFCYAYRLNRRRKWRQTFGSSSEAYGETFRFRPYSKSFVRHLDGFYAQFHPDEDFVETFAVWLTPGKDWRAQYKGWKAYEKLEYVDRLARSVRGKPPLKAAGRKYWKASSLRITLKNFYRKKKQLREEDFPEFHDGNLKRMFGIPPEAGGRTVVEILRPLWNGIVRDVAFWTGERKYVIHDLAKTVRQRCLALKLASADPDPVVVARLVSYLTTLVMNYRYTGWFRGHKARSRK